MSTEDVVNMVLKASIAAAQNGATNYLSNGWDKLGCEPFFPDKRATLIECIALNIGTCVCLDCEVLPVVLVLDTE